MQRKHLAAAVAAAMTLLATAGTASAATTYTVCPPPGACDASTIQGGINLASAGDTVSVSAGTYNENVNLNKAITLDGAGTATVVQPTASGPAITISVSGSPSTPITVSDLKATGATGGGNVGSGITISASGTASDITISNVESSSNSGNGFAVVSTAALARLAFDSVSFNSNGNDGARFPTSMNGLDGLTISDSHLDGNGFAGMEIYGPPSTVPVTNVSITNTTFSNDATKGIYAERLDHATLDGITVDHSGTVGGFAAGIDLNLKKQAFSDITLENSTISNSGTGDTTNGVGITIKSRDDGSNGPTSVTDVTVTGNTITGNQYGIRLGEPGKNNVGPTNVQIHDNDISGNVAGHGAINVEQTTADASCNWWGSASGPTSPANPGGTGDSVSSGFVFAPWQTSPHGACDSGTARGYKHAALQALSGIVPSGDKETDKRVSEAIDRIEQSLDPSYWVDDNHVDSKKGDKVFDLEKQAVQKLSEIKDPAPDGVDDAINDLLAADHKLAQTAIDDMTPGGDPKKLAEADKEMGKAADDTAAGKYGSAMEHYKNAWKQAQKA